MVTTAFTVPHTAVLGPPHPYRVRTSVMIRPFDGIGDACGDVARVLPLGYGRIALVLVDVAGHGVGRAVLATTVSDAIASEMVLTVGAA